MRIRGRIQLGVGMLAVLLLSACSRVADDWRAAQAADTTEAYQQFVQQHSGSEFDAQAQERIKQLAENRDWQGASSVDTRDAYEQFLAQHADSKWAQEARVRIENFQLASGGGSVADAGNSASGNGPGGGEVSAPPEPKAAVLVKPAGTKPAVPASRPTAAAAKSSATKEAAAKGAGKTADASTGMVYAQLGAFSSQARAEAEWQKLHGSVADLASLKPHYSVAKSGSENVYRLQVGVKTREQALTLCASLRKRSLACIPASG